SLPSPFTPVLVPYIFVIGTSLPLTTDPARAGGLCGDRSRLQPRSSGLGRTRHGPTAAGRPPWGTSHRQRINPPRILPQYILRDPDRLAFPQHTHLDVPPQHPRHRP